MKKCTVLWREGHFEVKMWKNATCSDHFWTSDVVARGRRKGFCTFRKVSKTGGFVMFCSSFKNISRRGTFEEDLQRCISRGRRDTRETCSSEMLGGLGADFLRGVAFWCIRPLGFSKMILRDRCSTSYDLAWLFRGRRSTLDRWSREIAKCIGTRPSALHSTFHFWRKSRRIASFLMLSTSKIEEARRIASFLTMPSSKIEEARRIASFLTLPISKIEEVSQNCFVFKLAERKIDR